MFFFFFGPFFVGEPSRPKKLVKNWHVAGGEARVPCQVLEAQLVAVEEEPRSIRRGRAVGAVPHQRMAQMSQVNADPEAGNFIGASEAQCGKKKRRLFFGARKKNRRPCPQRKGKKGGHWATGRVFGQGKGNTCHFDKQISVLHLLRNIHLLKTRP